MGVRPVRIRTPSEESPHRFEEDSTLDPGCLPIFLDPVRLEELQGALRALPKSLEEWRARKAAAEERAAALAVKRQVMDRRGGFRTLPQR